MGISNYHPKSGEGMGYLTNGHIILNPEPQIQITRLSYDATDYYHDSSDWQIGFHQLPNIH
jgi:hypothetical protein